MTRPSFLICFHKKRGIDNCFLVVVPDRKPKTLLAIIKQYIVTVKPEERRAHNILTDWPKGNSLVSLVNFASGDIKMWYSWEIYLDIQLDVDLALLRHVRVCKWLRMKDLKKKTWVCLNEVYLDNTSKKLHGSSTLGHLCSGVEWEFLYTCLGTVS
jgi:hypothetical protein